jgi:tetratricopeptide (TPR) repeat protein
MSGGQYTEYFKTLERVLKAAVSCYQPIELASALNNKSWDLCTNPEKEVRNGKLALRFAKIAVEITRRAAVQDQRTLAMYTDTLAAAYAEDGDFENAVKFQQEAVDIATTVLAYHLQEYRDRLELFKKKEPYREEDDKEEQEVW